MKSRFKNIKVQDNGRLFIGSRNGTSFQARFDLFIISQAWSRGLDLEEEADGFGFGEGTHGDWSGIRDSSTEAKNEMLEKALNFLFPN